jgi:hypothetical protein
MLRWLRRRQDARRLAQATPRRCAGAIARHASASVTLFCLTERLTPAGASRVARCCIRQLKQKDRLAAVSPTSKCADNHVATETTLREVR